MCRMLVLLCVSSTCLATSQHPTNQHKPEERPDGQSYWNKISSDIKTSSTICATNDKSLFAETGSNQTPKLQPSQKEMNGEESLYSSPFTLPKSGFQAPSSASLSSLLYPPNHWPKIPSGLHAVAVLMGHARDGKRTSVSCTCQGKHGEHHRGTTHGTLAHRIAGQSGPIGPIINGLEQTAAGSLRKLHGERCETRIPPKC